MSRLPSRAVRVGAVCLVQLALVGAAVAGPLSARLTGQEFLLEVGPVDPIDPFRGAYVDLDYPSLAGDAGRFSGDLAPGRRARCSSPWSATATACAAAGDAHAARSRSLPPVQ